MTGPDFKIAYDGTWYHEGQPIKREALAKLFADRALKIDSDGKYWLQTPYEKYPVEVEDVPFTIVSYKAGQGALHFTTNMDETITLGADHKWELRNDIPYVEVRKGLFARVTRPVYYHLVEEFGATLHSNGMTFRLGHDDE